MTEDLRQQGNALFLSKKYQAAIDVYSKVLFLNRQDWKSFSNRSAAWYATKDYGRALEDAEASIALNPVWHKVCRMRR